MVLRVTKKLAQKLKIGSLEELEENVSAFEEWYGHLFTADKIQYILLTNAYSLYSVILPGKGITDSSKLVESADLWLTEVLMEEGCGELAERFIHKPREAVEAFKTKDRGVLGSMNDMIFHAKFYLREYHLPLVETAKRLNEIPYSFLKYKNPLDVLKKMALS